MIILTEENYPASTHLFFKHKLYLLANISLLKRNPVYSESAFMKLDVHYCLCWHCVP